MKNLKNKKGFTLIELLAVIALLGLLAAIAVPSVISIANRMKKDMYCTKITVLESNAKLWGQDQAKTSLYSDSTVLNQISTTLDNFNQNPTEALYNQLNTLYKKATPVTVQTLLDEGYVKKDDLLDGKDIIKNPDTGESMNDAKLYVFIKNNRIYAKYPDSIMTCKDHK